MIYLDNAATTFPKPECVYEELDYANRHLAFNAGRGSYKVAKEASDLIQKARDSVASLVNASSDKVSFESSATESLNIIINGIDFTEGDTVYVSPFEHNAVIRPLFNLKDSVGINIKLLPFDKDTWDIDVSKMLDMFLIDKPKACFLTHISNVTGYALPYDVIFKQTKVYNCINVLDCSQSLGILNPQKQNVDFIVFAGHKSLYASFGIAGFINLNDTRLKVSKSGGTGSDSLNTAMPDRGFARYEAGSLNSVAIAGLVKSIEWLSANNVAEHERKMTKYIVSQLRQIPKIHLFHPESAEIMGIVSLAVEGYDPSDVGSILSDEFDICVRVGYHCAPFAHDFMGSKQYGGTVRISLSYFTSKAEIDFLIDALKSL